MNTNLPTAEEFLRKNNFNLFATSPFTEMLIEFAKIHVKEALQAAYENGMLHIIDNEEYREDVELIDEYNCGSHTIVLHKPSIINSYPQELIK